MLSTCEDVGRIGAQAQVGTLVLDHFIPGIGDHAATADDFQQAVATNFDGQITVGRDLLEIPFG